MARAASAGGYEFDEAARLGAGAYGTVFRGHCRRTNNPVAVKVVDVDDEGIPATSIREVAILKVLSHPNVVQLFGVACEEGRLLLFFEFVERDLKKHIRLLEGNLTPRSVQHFTKQLLVGLDYCHSMRIIHRDLKPHNLLIAGGMALKIADFGLARAFSLPMPEYEHEVVTLYYRAPEILLGCKQYGIEIDVWSAACIVAEMATGRPLFVGDCEIGTLFGIFAKLGTPTHEVWPELHELPDFKETFPKWRPKGWHNIRNTLQKVGRAGVDLLEKMTVYRPCARVSARRALLHSYFGQAPLMARDTGGDLDVDAMMEDSGSVVDDSADER
eukprot:TRINITY_DN33401_c1_g2_i1.p1 TRINITY_DN33401_c1_g2~~TRINITY_DN33401_c1_g2_i1.p1  ORF type:complete len:349 (-),score=43.25 TRINITY_DN33401_c1_g2_i1:462-1448(-)